MIRTSTLIANILFALTAQSSLAATFQRQDINRCVGYYMSKLGVDENEMRRVCSNYTDDNLDCAVNLMRSYGTSDHRGAIKVCILPLNREASTKDCTVKKMSEARSQGQSIDIPSFISDCRNPGASTYRQQPDNYDSRSRQSQLPPIGSTHTPTPSRVQTPSAVVPPPVVQVPARPQLPPETPRRRAEDSDAYYIPPSGMLIDKIKKADFVRETAKWLNIKPQDIRAVNTEEYLNMLNSMLETVAINYLGREVRIYVVTFTASGSEVSCVGTDFSPVENKGFRYFTIHNCSVNRQHGVLANKFGELNYSFMNNISAPFKERMKIAERQWSGDDINFRKDVSDYLVIGY